ncbi:MAG: CYTH domain-containing protein [Hyphomicrobiaceae bacterium]|nr:CYTH domain-containing protein [Hyphomicrobiaceae bacterium]
MAIEIERKFIVIDPSWRQSVNQSRFIRQGYLTNGDAVSVRVRIIDDSSATLTVKSPKSGLSRFEFEQDICLREGQTLMELCNGNTIEKTRHQIDWAGHIWEIDHYQGRNRGLVVAEIELRNEQQNFETPPWLGKEITGIPHYQNTLLAVRPFQTWPEQTEIYEAVGN